MEETPQQIGPYQIIEEIGRGDIAIVYRATDTIYQRPVALKVLPAYFAHNLAFIRYFVSEGRDAMRLQHPNIVPVFDAGHADNFNYIAQELMPAGTLADLIKAQGGALPYEMTVAIVEQIAAGLDYAHHQQYTHRNLNFHNVLFADQGKVKIGDFSRGNPPRGMVPSNYHVGSLAFMAPEQARGDESVDAYADIYSLGVLTYLMLTGRLPFEADNPLVLLRKIMEDPPPLVENFNPAVPFGAAYAVHQALSKQASLRHTTAAAFAQALGQTKAAVATIPVEGKPELPSVIPVPPTGEIVPEAAPDVVAGPTPTLLRTRARRSVWLERPIVSMFAGAILTTLVAIFLIAIVQARSTFLDILIEQNDPKLPAVVAVPTLTRATVTPAQTPGNVQAQIVAPATGVTNQKLQSVAFVDTPAPTIVLSPVVILTTPTELPTETETPTALATETLTPTAEATVAPVAALAGKPTGRIAYSVWNPHTDRYDVRIYNLTTGVSWPQIPDKRQPDFSPTNMLAANSEGGDIDNLVQMGPGGEGPLAIGIYAQDSRPHWAPSGRAIVYDSDLVGNGRYRIYLLPDTEFGHTVGPMRYDAWELLGRYPVFLGDGRIAYNGCNVWENGSSCGLYVVDTSGGKPANVTNWPGDLPTDNLGAQVLVMSNRDGNWNVYLINPNGNTVQQLTQTTGHNGLATASPDGNYIAFATDRDKKWSVYVMRVDGSETHKLFDLEEGYAGGDHDWIEERLSWGQ
ncbi:MAG: protein kinase [Chloroflexi bacterium]|nr:protein kinase [Chloroflexota bacterium]